MYDQRLHGGMVGFCWTADGDQGTKEGMVRINFDEHGRIIQEPEESTEDLSDLDDEDEEE